MSLSKSDLAELFDLITKLVKETESEMLIAEALYIGKDNALEMEGKTFAQILNEMLERGFAMGEAKGSAVSKLYILNTIQVFLVSKLKNENI